MLYIKVLVAAVAVGVGVRVDDVEDGEAFRVSGNGDTQSRKALLQSVETTVMDKIMAITTAKPMAGSNHGAAALDFGDPASEKITNSKFKTEVQKMLDDMMKKTKTANLEAQQSVTASFASFGVCDKAMAAKMIQKGNEQKIFDGSKSSHFTCRTEEAATWIVMDACTKNVARLNAQHQQCTADIAKHSDARPATCNAPAGESELDWLERMKSTFTAKLATLKTKITDCTKKGDELQKEMLACEVKTKTHTDKQKACDTSGVNMDMKACAASSTSITACFEQGTCHAAAVASYNIVTADVKLQEADHKVEYRISKRIECLLGALGSATAGTANTAALNTCITTVYTTTDVEIKYLAIPAEPSCPDHPLAPCTEGYKTYVYSHLPEHAKGQCTACSLPAQVAQVPTPQPPPEWSGLKGKENNDVTGVEGNITYADDIHKFGLCKVSDWTDHEDVCTSEVPEHIFGDGLCRKKKSKNVGIWVTYADGLDGYATYPGVQDKWCKKNFNGINPNHVGGMMKNCNGLHFLTDHSCKGLPMAWAGCQTQFSSNFDIDFKHQKCSDFRATKTGWKKMRVRLYCDCDALGLA